MVERAAIANVFSTTDARRQAYRVELNEHFGHLEPDTLLEMMRVFRDDSRSENPATMQQLHQKLADKMLLVGGNNSIGIEQLRVAGLSYDLDSKAWDQLIALHEREQGGEKHG